MKKGYITIYVLIVLLLLSLLATFLYTQDQNTADFNQTLYNKKSSKYLAESLTNVYIDSNRKKIDEAIRNYEIKLIKENKITQDQKKHINGSTLISDFYEYGSKYYTITLAYLTDFNEPVTDSYGEGIKYSYLLKSKESIIYGDSSSEIRVYFKPIVNPIIKNDKLMIYEEIYNNLSTINLKSYPITSSDLNLNPSGIVHIPGDLNIGDESINKFSGILMVDGNMIVDKEFTVDGFLIVKGKIETNKPLNINGGLVVGEIDNSDINYKYNPTTYLNYIKLDENIVDTKIISASFY